MQIKRKGYSFKELKNSILTYNLTPHGFALSFTTGLVCGLFPVIGLTTLLSAFVAIILKCNMWVVQAVNWLAASLQLLMIIPFIRMGELMSGQENTVINSAAVASVFSSGWRNGVLKVLEAQSYAILAWVVFSLPASVIIYKSARLLAEKRKRKKESAFKEA